MIDSRPQKNLYDKLLEKIPPIITWLILLFPIVGSFFFPVAVGIFVIIFNVFFLYRSIAFTFQFIGGLIFIREGDQIDWISRVKGLMHIDTEIKELRKERERIKKLTFEKNYNDIIKYHSGRKGKVSRAILRLPTRLQKFIYKIEKRKTSIFLRNEITRLQSLKDKNLTPYEQINHVVIIPHAKEPIEILNNTLTYLSKQTFPTKQIHIVLGAEALDKEGYSKSMELKKRWKNVFGNIWISNHVLQENEIIGKSSNMAAAGKVASEEIAKLGWDLKKTVVTSCDADSRLPSNYFSYLTYEYITRENAEYKFYNGAILFYANIWKLKFVARIRNSLSTIYNIGKLVRSDKLVPFSTYSTSFWLVKEIGFWTPWITPEDYHLFFKATFKYSHQVSTVPLYTTVYSDAAEGEGYIDEFKNNYYQARRWAWGVSDDGWIIKNMIHGVGTLSLGAYYRSFHVIFDHIFAPVSAFLLLLGANLPPLLNPEFRGQVFGTKLPGISSLIIRITTVTFLLVILIDILLKPRRENVSIMKKILTPLEWFAQPIAGMIFTALPGVDAHTRLLFGRYLEYYLTKKKA